MSGRGGVQHLRTREPERSEERRDGKRLLPVDVIRRVERGERRSGAAVGLWGSGHRAAVVGDGGTDMDMAVLAARVGMHDDPDPRRRRHGEEDQQLGNEAPELAEPPPHRRDP